MSTTQQQTTDAGFAERKKWGFGDGRARREMSGILFQMGTNEIGNVQFLKEPLSKGKILCMLMAGDDILSRIVLKA